MNPPSTLIQRKQLKLLADHGSVKSAVIVGNADTFSLRVATFGGEVVLYDERGKIRSWKNVNTVLSYLKEELGIAKASIEFDRWSPEQRGINA